MHSHTPAGAGNRAEEIQAGVDRQEQLPVVLRPKVLRQPVWLPTYNAIEEVEPLFPTRQPGKHSGPGPAADPADRRSPNRV